MGVAQEEIFLFAYGSLMEGEREHPHLVGHTRLGPDRTLPGYRLVELGPYPAMIVGGEAPVDGELFAIARQLLIKLDGVKELGRLFHRKTIELESGKRAEVYLMNEDQVRGRRRLKGTSWKGRFSSSRFPRR